MKKIYVAAGLVAMAQLGMAQSRLGMELKNPQLRAPQTQISETHVNGQSMTGNRAVTVLYSDDFSSGSASTLPTGWTMVDSTSPSSGVVWKWTNVGHTGSYPTAAIQSPSAANGWMIVDSDLDGDATTDEHTVLISPAYDVSAEASVGIQFYQMMREFQNDITNVAVSGDNGATWTYFEINAGIGQSGTPNPDLVFLNVSSVCANASQMRVKFSWQGAWDYGWQIDDFSVVIPPDHEVVLTAADFYSGSLSNIWGENIRYTLYPTTQRDPAGVEFRAVMSNNGAQSQTGVTSTIEVRNAANTVVYTGVTNGLNLGANARDTGYSTTTFALPAAVETHSVNYAINYANLAQDEDPTNNTATYGPINITQYVMGMDQNQYSGGGLFGGQTGGNDNAYIMGNHFMCFSNQTLNGVQVAFSASTRVGTQVYPVVIEIDPNATQFANLYSNFIFDGSGTNYEIDLTANQISTTNNMVLVNLDIVPQALEAGKEYIIGFGCYGGNPTTDRVVVMNGERDHPNMAHTVLYSNGSNGITWYYTSSTPVIRANFDPTIGVNEVSASVAVANVYPNPVNDIATIELSLTESAVVAVEVVDITGKVVITNNHGTLSAGATRLNVNVSELSEGTYFCTIVVNGERITKKMVVTH